jgi:hypothetical protein
MQVKKLPENEQFSLSTKLFSLLFMKLTLSGSFNGSEITVGTDNIKPKISF